MNTKTVEAIKIASEKGYTVDEDGHVTSPVGKPRKLQSTTSGYLVFNIGIGNGGRYPVNVHRLQAYQKFGENALKPGIQARHLDGKKDNNSSENIAIGTGSENMMDKAAIDRIKHAKRAGVFRESTIPVEVMLDIKSDHTSGLSYNALHEKYGVSKSTLSYHLSPNAQRVVSDVTVDLKPIPKTIDMVHTYLSTGCSVSEVSRKHDVPRRTVSDRFKKFCSRVDPELVAILCT